MNKAKPHFHCISALVPLKNTQSYTARLVFLTISHGDQIVVDSDGPEDNGGNNCQENQE